MNRKPKRPGLIVKLAAKEYRRVKAKHEDRPEVLERLDQHGVDGYTASLNEATDLSDEFLENETK